MAMHSPKKSFSSAIIGMSSVSAIVTMVGGFALFVFIASQLLISYPTNSYLASHVLGMDRWKRPGLVSLNRNDTEELLMQYEALAGRKEDVIIQEITSGARGQNGSVDVPALSPNRSGSPSDDEVSEFDGSLLSGLRNESSDELQEEVATKSSLSSSTTTESSAAKSSGSANGTQEQDAAKSTKPSIGMGDQGSSKIPESTTGLGFSNLSLVVPPSDTLQKSDLGRCDLFSGKWVYDPAGPLYTNNTCPFITQTQNCQGNGRPDKEYEFWRWKPDRCDLPRFDGRKFLEMMRGKTIAFFGDSVARNQFESLLCMLSQVEIPKNRGNRKMQKWYFKSTNTFVSRIWSSWLVHQTSEPLQFAPKDVVKIHLDLPDQNLMEHLLKFDVVILSSGHWFAKQSVYVLNNMIVGGQLWWPNEAGKMQINNVEAFAISVKTVLTAIAKHPNYTGLVITRSFSPDHYEGGQWNTGGSCTGKTKPSDKITRNQFTDVMHEKQVTGFQQAVNKTSYGAKLRLMDITEAFSYRYDGHPGPYRSPDPNKITKRGPNGEPPPQDCLHWCMPGPVDTWNEMLMEMIRREFAVA